MLKLENPSLDPTFVRIRTMKTSIKAWKKLERKFSLKGLPCIIVFYLKELLPSLDFLINIFHVWFATMVKEEVDMNFTNIHDNIILNLLFENRLYHWSGKKCNIFSHDVTKGEVRPSCSQHLASTTIQFFFAWNH
jgi:hypothetical protein